MQIAYAKHITATSYMCHEFCLALCLFDSVNEIAIESKIIMSGMDDLQHGMIAFTAVHIYWSISKVMNT